MAGLRVDHLDAWNNVTFAAEEVRDPERTVRRALVAGTVLVVVLYLAAILAYLVVLPALGDPQSADPFARGIAHAARDRIGSAVMEVIFGPTGAPAAALLFQGVWVSALTLSGTYGDLLDYVIFAALLFYALTVVATLRIGSGATSGRRMVAAPTSPSRRRS